jgi:hypothetical protein
MTGSVAGHDGGVSRVRLSDAWYKVKLKRCARRVIRTIARGAIILAVTFVSSLVLSSKLDIQIVSPVPDTTGTCNTI